MGDGSSDSSIDVILQKNSPTTKDTEILEGILCSKENPEVHFKYDILLSSLLLSSIDTPGEDSQETKPPTIPNTKHKIKWSDKGIQKYRSILPAVLQSLQVNYESPTTLVSFSVLSQCKNQALTSAALKTNESTDMSKEKKAPTPFIPPTVKAAAKDKKESHKTMKKVNNDPESTHDDKDVCIGKESVQEDLAPTSCWN